MKHRFRFHGYAIGASGRIEQPFSELLEVQAATALPQIGGRASARSASFNFRDIFKFDRAYSEITGSDCKDEDCSNPPTSHSTHLRCTVEGLDIMSTVTADKVVANLVSTNSPASGGEAAVRLLGTRFENLRIAGIPVKVTLATDILDKYDTHEALQKAYLANKTEDEKAVRALIDRPEVKAATGDAAEHFRQHIHFFESKEGLPANKRGTTFTSLVQSVEPERSGLDKCEHVIHVKGFGTVHLGELHISQRTRLVSMVQVHLDCPYKGLLMCCEMSDGGGIISQGDGF